MRQWRTGCEMGSGPPATQYFTYGPWEFNIRKAEILAAARKYRAESCRPSPEWVGPFIDIDHKHVEHGNLSKPLIFATVIRDGQAFPLLIDGHHRALKALNGQKMVRTITLDLADSLKVLKAPEHFMQEMIHDGRMLGLLPSDQPH
jgi:hypothetical protein